MFNTLIFLAFLDREQPPSRGCVLKQKVQRLTILSMLAAAFARLCVETLCKQFKINSTEAAAFARLCVETPISCSRVEPVRRQPPSRGCVLKLN